MSKKKALDKLKSSVLQGLQPQEPKEVPHWSMGFRLGPQTGSEEIYWSVCAVFGRKAKLVTDPRDKSHPIFKEKNIAEQMVQDLERKRQKGEFKGVHLNGTALSCFATTELYVGKQSKLLRPSMSDISSINLSRNRG